MLKSVHICGKGFSCFGSPPFLIHTDGAGAFFRCCVGVRKNKSLGVFAIHRHKCKRFRFYYPLKTCTNFNDSCFSLTSARLRWRGSIFLRAYDLGCLDGRLSFNLAHFIYSQFSILMIGVGFPVSLSGRQRVGFPGSPSGSQLSACFGLSLIPQIHAITSRSASSTSNTIPMVATFGSRLIRQITPQPTTS